MALAAGGRRRAGDSRRVFRVRQHKTLALALRDAFLVAGRRAASSETTTTTVRGLTAVVLAVAKGVALPPWYGVAPWEAGAAQHRA